MNRARWGLVRLLGVIALLGALVGGCESPPELDYGPTAFQFDVLKEGARPAEQVLRVSNVGGGTLDWAMSSDVPWVLLSRSVGSSVGEVDEVAVSVDTRGMSAGDYSGVISIETPGLDQTSRQIPVSLKITTVWHEESLRVNCTLGSWCEKSLTFRIEEGQEVYLWWHAYGDMTDVAVFLERPDGGCEAGYAGTTTGPIDKYTPSERCHFFHYPSSFYHLDLGHNGTLHFYCSSTYDERSGRRLYPPGEYRLKFDVVAEYPYYVSGNEGDPTEMLIKVEYRIE